MSFAFLVPEYVTGAATDLADIGTATLGRFSPNISLTDVQGGARVMDCPSRFVSPPPKRRRVTARLRADVVDAYESGQTSR